MLITQSCLTLCNSMDCSPPGSSVLGVLQARIPEWVAIPFSKGSYWPRDWTWVSWIVGRFLYHLAWRSYLISQLSKHSLLVNAYFLHWFEISIWHFLLCPNCLSLLMNSNFCSVNLSLSSLSRTTFIHLFKLCHTVCGVLITPTRDRKFTPCSESRVLTPGSPGSPPKGSFKNYLSITTYFSI